MSYRTNRSLLQLLVLLLALAIPMTGCDRKGDELADPSGDADSAELGDGLEDAGITAKVMTRLATDERTDAAASDVEVDTRAGVVTLAGAVDGEKAKTAAEEIARAIEGVSRVVNKIKVGSGESSAT